MKKNTTILIIIILIASTVAYAVVVAPLLEERRSSVPSSDTTVKEISCAVGVTNPRVIPIVKNGDLIIEYSTCEQQFVRSCGRFGVFSDSGTVSLTGSGGAGSSTSVKISEGATESYSLSWCGSKLTTEFHIKLINDNNEEIYDKKVVLQ